MKNRVTSYQKDLSSEKAASILKENGFENIELNIDAMGHKFKGYGHREIYVIVSKGHDNITLSKTITDMTLTDAWGDEEETVPGAWYESQEEVMESAFSRVISTEYNQQKLEEFLNQ